MMDTIGEEERRARVMELAEHQMEALQRLDGVVENQRALLERTRSSHRERRRREEGDGGEEEEVPPDDEGGPHAEHAEGAPNDNPRRAGRQGNTSCPITHLYLAISVLLAVLAIVTSPSNTLFPSIRVSVTRPAQQKDREEGGNAKEVREVGGKHVAEGMDMGTSWAASGRESGMQFVAHSKARQPSPAEPQTEKMGADSLPTSSPSTWTSWTDYAVTFVREVNEHVAEHFSVFQKLQRQSHQPVAGEAAEPPAPSQRWLPPWEWKNQKQPRARDVPVPVEGRPKLPSRSKKNSFANVKLHALLAPVLRSFDPFSVLPSLPTNEGRDTAAQSPTDHANGTGSGAFLSAIDTIFTSTPRLIAVANLLLAVTYLLQTAVADLFLGPVSVHSATANPRGAAANNRLVHDPATRRRRAGRERLGGFLLFKLLLISAVLEPDSFDLFILLSWYTLLSFLRSLAHLAGTTARHVAQSGEAPGPGALRLLVLVLACDAFAAIGCVAAFSPAGVHMLLLLTSDCVVLAIDATIHILRHCGATMEEAYRLEVTELEERQVELREESSDAVVPKALTLTKWATPK
ncbi:hypothetical protein ACHAXT_006775 [Thalassiosira profunda]